MFIITYVFPLFPFVFPKVSFSIIYNRGQCKTLCVSTGRWYQLLYWHIFLRHLFYWDSFICFTETQSVWHKDYLFNILQPLLCSNIMVGTSHTKYVIKLATHWRTARIFWLNPILIHSYKWYPLEKALSWTVKIIAETPISSNKMK